MAPFDFKLEIHFVGSSDGTSLQVYELTKSPTHFSSIQKADWKKVATINPKQDDDDDDGVYGGLLFFDGHGRIDEREALTMLAQHLKQLRLLVSPEGYCFQQVSEFGVYSDFGIHYVRLNDLFSWPRCGVELVTINSWTRLELKYSKGGHLPKYHNNPTSSKPISCGGACKAKHAELERLVKEKDKELRMFKMKKDNDDEEKAKEQRIDELEKLNDALEEANKTKDEELQKLAKSKNVGEMQRQLKKKEGELVMLKKKKDEEVEAKEQRIDELEKQNEALEEANKTKDEELQKLAKSKNTNELQRQLKKKDDQLQMLKKKKDEEDEAKEKRIEELQKLNEELEEGNKVKEEELQKLAKSKNMGEMQRQLKKKNDELQLLKKKKDEEEEVRVQRIDELEKQNENLEEANRAKDDELRKLAKSKKNGVEKNDETTQTRKVEEVSSSAAKVAEVRKELEECQRKSWAILPSTKYLIKPDYRDKYLTTRQRVPPTTFGCVPQMIFPYVNNSPKLVDKMRVDGDYAVSIVDEESNPGEWPPPPTIMVHLGNGEADFDKNNWWNLKTTHKDGGLTMVVYYEGSRSQISIYPYPDYDTIIPLPFSNGILEVYTFWNHFALFRLPFGVRYGFAYRPK